MEAWLEREKENVLLEKVKRFKTKEKNEENTLCIICKKPNVFLCPHCFTKKVYEIMKKNASQKLIEQFLVFFNYELKNDD